MRTRGSSPFTLCVAGFTWLTLGSILGLAIMIGLVRGTPLPPWVRAVHVHAVLLGGVAQLILGGLFLLMTPPPSNARTDSDSHPLTFWTLNGGLLVMLIGLWLPQNLVVSVSGLVVIAGCVSAIHSLWVRMQRAWNVSLNHSWYYALALAALVGGSACGLLLALGIIPDSYGHLRLAHIHLVVLGFIGLSLIGMMHHILPLVWSRPLANPRLLHLTTYLLPIAAILLIGGFLNSSVPVELAAGVILLAGVGLLVGNLLSTWLSSSHTGSAASDHLMVSTFFLLFTILLGMLMGANNWSSRPLLPYGKLHLIAYTHMAFVGFMMNAVMGASSYLLPMALAADRVVSAKKRSVYLDQLTAIMNRGRSIQIAALSLGTMGLGILAALTWNVPLTSIYVHIALWTSLALLLTSCVLFAIKLTTIFAKRPESISIHQEPPQEFKPAA